MYILLQPSQIISSCRLVIGNYISTHPLIYSPLLALLLYFVDAEDDQALCSTKPSIIHRSIFDDFQAVPYTPNAILTIGVCF